MQQRADDRRPQAAPAGAVQGADVVDPAVAVVVEAHAGRHGLGVQAADDDVEVVRVGVPEQSRRELQHPQVVLPGAEPDIGVGAGAMASSCRPIAQVVSWWTNPEPVRSSSIAVSLSCTQAAYDVTPASRYTALIPSTAARRCRAGSP